MSSEIFSPLGDGPEAEVNSNQKVGLLTSGVAGIASGVIKIPKGIASLTAELIDLGADTKLAVDVEQFFDKINPFEEIANQRLSGRITEALVQIGVPSAAGAKVATKMAENALKAKRANAYANLTNPNLIKAASKADELNKLSTIQRYGAIAAGGAVGETLVADVEKLGTMGEAFGIGPTQLDEFDREGGREDATRKLLNRFKFGTESLLLTPFVFGATEGAVKLAKHGKELAYSSSALERTFDKIGSAFRFRGQLPIEQALGKELEAGLRQADTSLAMEQVTRIDREINKIFPEANKFFNSSSSSEKKNFLETLDKSLFSGNLSKPLGDEVIDNIRDTMIKRGAKEESVSTVLTGLQRTRTQFADLINIASKGRTDVPEGLISDLTSLMGNRVKNIVSNTYDIFDDKYASFFEKYPPSQESVNKVKQIFMRYASKNNNPITDLEAQGMVNNILEKAAKMNPKVDKLPTITIPNLKLGPDVNNPYIEKTFVRTLEKDLPGGLKEIEVIGKGSKAFRELFGEVNDVRHSIFEGMNRLSSLARRNQLYDDILNVDSVAKSKITDQTPLGQRGFFHDTPLDAQRAFGNNVDVVKIDDYIQNDFKGGGMVNALQGKYTTKAIAEGFSNSSKIQDFMRGDTATTPLGKTFSWAWRNLVLLPKAGSQYSKTILSIPTQVKNFLSNGVLTIGNGTLFESPEIMKEALKKAGATVQVGVREPLNMDRYRRYLELQIANNNVKYGDLKNLMKDSKIIGGNLNTDSVFDPFMKSLGIAGKKLKQGAKFFEDTYVAGDDFFKIFNFEVELARRSRAYAKAGINKTVDELEREAAEIVKNTVPSYSRVGDLVKAARLSPFGNFMSFSSEVFRTGAGMAEQIVKDLKDPITGSLNPITSTNIMKEIALKRLIGMATATATIPYGVVEGSKAIFGVTDEEARAASNFVAPWAKDSLKAYFKDPETGKLSFFDFSKFFVYDTLSKPFVIMLNRMQSGVDKGEPLLTGFFKGIAEAAGQTASPFVDPAIYTEAFLDISFRGGRTAEGRELYTEQTPFNEKVSRTMAHLAEAFYPSYKPFTRTYQAITGEPGRGGTLYEVPNELGGIFGLRREEIDPKKTMGFYVTDFQEGERNSRKEFTGKTLTGEIKTPQYLIERYYVANKSLFEVQQKMANQLKDAKTLGMSKSELATLFKSRGLSDETVNDLSRGKFDPFVPSENIIKRFREISNQTGQPNPYIEAQSTLRSINNAFRQQNLFQPLTINLDQFLNIQGEEGFTSPLSLGMPPQSMPNASILTPPVNQVAGLQNGLTPTENALLSESEKQMRLRQRGLA